MPNLDTRVARIGRIYDCWLGGRDNFAADREAAEKAISVSPQIKPGVFANRRFHGRAVRYMADAGIRQFIDIGSGIPTANNTHEVAQARAPESRVVYVDNDPLVLSHSHVLLTNTTAPTAYIDADARDVGKILAEAENTLDFSQPIGVMLIAVLHCIPDADDPYSLVRALLGAVPPGSYLAITQPGRDGVAAQLSRESLSKSLGQELAFRTEKEIAGFFADVDLIEPGIVAIQDWRPETAEDMNSLPTNMIGGIGRKAASRGERN